MDWLRNNKLYVTAAVAALVAANSVIHFVPPDVMTLVVTVLAGAGLYDQHVSHMELKAKVHGER